MGGQDGVIIRANGENWELVETESGPEEDIWGLYSFRAQLFVSTDLQPVDAGGSPVQDIEAQPDDDLVFRMEETHRPKQ